MNSEETKQMRLNSFLKNIWGMSDKNYQSRVWVNHEGPECDDIDDTIMDFFDDGEDIIEKYKEFGINECQIELILKLQVALESFKDKYDVYLNLHATANLIKTAEWSEIRKVAKQVLDSFDWGAR